MAKRNNFLIMAMGRSGTKFLANLMNRSQVWTVEHEPNGSHDEREPVANIAPSFNRDHYGEVNSRLRYAAKRLPVAKVGVIVRDPYAVWASILNRKPPEQWDRLLRDYERTAEALSELWHKGAWVISFARMVEDPWYTAKVLRTFGVEDVEVSLRDLGVKVNVTQDRVYTPANIPEKHKKRLDVIFHAMMDPFVLVGQAKRIV